MPIYVALLRGVMPANKNTNSQKLKETFESLGLQDVKTVIGSGNVVFSSTSKSAKKLELEIEKILEVRLKFKTVAIVRDKDEIMTLIHRSPFEGIKDEKQNYLVVTFFKDKKPELCTTLNLESVKTPDLMRALEKKYGKTITTRTWKTVHRIAAKMV